MWILWINLLIRAALGVAISISSNSDSNFNNGGLSYWAMANAFKRSDKAHEESMAALSRSMTMTKAVEVIQKSRSMTSELSQAMQMAVAVQKNLRRQTPSSYSGVDSARKLLNDMIFQSMTKYDAEVMKCSEYYANQCATMEELRGQISAANYISANSWSLVMDAQGNIQKCQAEIPRKRIEVKHNQLKCEALRHQYKSRLEIVIGDIAVMTTILEMTDCDKSMMQQKRLSLLRCRDPCTKKSFITFEGSAGLQAKVKKLKAAFSRDLMNDAFSDLFEGVESMEALTLIETGSQQLPVINKTSFNNPPVPITQVPSDPCIDPDQGAPSKTDKRSAKCSFGGNPQCYKLQERFLLIQAGISDERDQLLEELNELEQSCKETEALILKQINNDERLLQNSQTKLADATEKEDRAQEIARTTERKHTGLEKDFQTQMKTCSANYINYETEMCALKKIRGELYKMKGGGHSAFFSDCAVTKWDPEQCSKKCGKGIQKLTRSILTHSDGGSKCLPLSAMRTCNPSPCPVDCQLAAWDGWSKCSAQCGGGVTQRLREVKVAPRFGGHPCSPQSMTIPCGTDACEKDCDLSDWTKWSVCSKDCDGGTQKRQKFITHEAEGAGKCADEWSVKRLQYKHCKMVRCITESASEPLKCNRSLDVVLLLDGSGSLGKAGWAAEVSAAKHFIRAFNSAGDKVNMAVILFSGPRTWSGVAKCIGGSTASASLEACDIHTVTHFTTDLKKVDQLVSGLTWPQGSTLTSLALMTASNELNLGRGDAHSLVVVVTDGRPMSYRKTTLAARDIRKKARLLWVPVTKFAPLKQIREWATRRWQENVVKVDDFETLRTPQVITHIIANICPASIPEVRFERR